MNFDDIKTGCIIPYPYLWAHEADRGEIEGRKQRPVAVGVRLQRQDGDALLLFPITTKEPSADRLAVEIPDMEKRRAGLDTTMRLWLILDEYNLDTVGTSYYLEPEPPIGRFSKAFLLPLLREFQEQLLQTRKVDRN